MVEPASPLPRQMQHDANRLARALPALLAEAKRLAATLMAGAHGRRRAGTGETFWQYRDYTTYDPASRIDWRQSARSPSRLFVRETEWETAATVRLWCGGGSSFDYTSGDGPTKRWRAQVIGGALGFALTRGGEHFGTLPATAPAGRGATAVAGVIDGFLRSSPTIGPLPVPERATQAVYLSDFYQPTEDVVRDIRAIAHAGIPAHIVEVYDPAEALFPFDGHTEFRSLNTDETSRRFGRAQAVKDAYENVRAAHRDAIRAACSANGLTYLSHRTDRPAASVFAALHRAIAGASAR